MMGESEEQRIIRYEADGSVTLLCGERVRSIAAGWTSAAIDAAAAAFFAAQS